MHILMTGGTGFVGQALTEKLHAQGDEITILTRQNKQSSLKNVTYVKWQAGNESIPVHKIKQIDGIVNLAGESLNNGRWTVERKKNIVKSRVDTTLAIVELIQALETKPKVLINASAIGYYGMSDEMIFTEKSLTQADDFLSQVVQSWEETAKKAERYGVRTVFTRFGLILGEAGVLSKIILPYKLGVGGTVGSGKQWLSWVHIEDVVGMICFAIEHEFVQGPLNVTSPQPVQMKTMGKTIGSVMRRPHWLPVPGFALKVALGEMSNLLLYGQHVLPDKAQAFDYKFHYLKLEDALQSILLK